MGLKNAEARWARRMFGDRARCKPRKNPAMRGIGRKVKLMCEGRAPDLDKVVGLLWSNDAWAAAWARVRERTYKRSGVLLEAHAPELRRYKTVFLDAQHELWGYFDEARPGYLLTSTSHRGRWKNLDDYRDYAPDVSHHTNGAPVALHVTTI